MRLDSAFKKKAKVIIVIVLVNNLNFIITQLGPFSAYFDSVDSPRVAFYD